MFSAALLQARPTEISCCFCVDEVCGHAQLQTQLGGGLQAFVSNYQQGDRSVCVCMGMICFPVMNQLLSRSQHTINVSAFSNAETRVTLQPRSALSYSLFILHLYLRLAYSSPCPLQFPAHTNAHPCLHLLFGTKVRHPYLQLRNSKPTRASARTPQKRDFLLFRLRHACLSTPG